MQYIVRSAAGANLQTCHLTGKPVVIKPNSSLNQKLGIQADVALGENDKPFVQYAVAGNRGHRSVVGADQIPYPLPVQHDPKHSGMYNMLPMVLRLPNNDLTPAERAGYRLRKMVTFNNQTYVAYYALKLDLTETLPTLELRTVDGDTVTSTPFNWTLDDLSPVQPTIPPGQALVTSGDYIASTAKVPFLMTTAAINEYLNAANIIYGDSNYGLISELGLAHGVDRSVNGDFNGTPAPYLEAIGCQITTFVATFWALRFMNSNLKVTFDIGSVEPLLTLGTAN